MMMAGGKRLLAKITYKIVPMHFFFVQAPTNNKILDVDGGGGATFVAMFGICSYVDVAG